MEVDPAGQACVLRFLANSIHRDYDQYIRSLDESLQKKMRLVTPWLPEARPGTQPLYVDVGTGTGSLAHALSRQYSDARVVGVDASPKMVAHAKSHYDAENLKYYLATAGKRFARNADAAIYGSILHEIYSFSGDNLKMVEDTLKVAYSSLRPGGRVIIRDFVGPDNPRRQVVLRLKKSALVPGKTFTDFSEAWAKRGRAVPATKVGESDAVVEYQTDMGSAMEFLFRYKDSQWEPELAERYFFWNKDQAQTTLQNAGFRVIHAEKEDNRRKVMQIEMEHGVILDPGTRRKLRLPEDKMVIVGERTVSN